MPILGFGVFQIADEQECERAVAHALETGYRLIDTAASYMNERAVGRAIRASGIPRQDLFITTKLWLQDAGEKTTPKAFAKSLEKLGLDYLDLYLIHQPFGDYYGAWRAMEGLYEQGSARAIGVANFYPDRLVDLILHSEIKPAINQIETHPFFQRADYQEKLVSLGVQIESWGPKCPRSRRNNRGWITRRTFGSLHKSGFVGRDYQSPEGIRNQFQNNPIVPTVRMNQPRDPY